MFDVINETIEKMRPGSSDYVRYTTASSNRRLQDHYIQCYRPKMEDVRRNIIERISKYENIKVAIGGSTEGATLFDGRIETLVREDLKSHDKEWRIFSFEEEQIKAKIADMILSDLLAELVKDLNSVIRKRSQR